jgi:hypothetical protein
MLTIIDMNHTAFKDGHRIKKVGVLMIKYFSVIFIFLGLIVMSACNQSLDQSSVLNSIEEASSSGLELSMQSSPNTQSFFNSTATSQINSLLTR